MVKPKLVTQPAIVYGIFVTPTFELQLQAILIGQQSDDKQPIKLTNALLTINKATYWPPGGIRDGKRGY